MSVSDTKRCPKCGLVKPRSDFYPLYRMGTHPNDSRRAPYCKPCSCQHRKDWYAKHPEAAAIHARTQHARERLALLRAYGGRCACCGFGDLAKTIRGRSFLEIDHPNGRKHGRTGRNLYDYLRRHGYPQNEVRILCIACNAAMEPGEARCELHKWEKQP